MRIARKINDQDGVATSTVNLAELALDRGLWAEAEALAREALPLAEAIRRQDLIACDNTWLAKALVRQGKMEEARAYAERGVEILERLKSHKLDEAREVLAECVPPTP